MSTHVVFPPICWLWHSWAGPRASLENEDRPRAWKIYFPPKGWSVAQQNVGPRAENKFSLDGQAHPPKGLRSAALQEGLAGCSRMVGALMTPWHTLKWPQGLGSLRNPRVVSRETCSQCWLLDLWRYWRPPEPISATKFWRLAPGPILGRWNLLPQSQRYHSLSPQMTSRIFPAPCWSVRCTTPLP